MDRELRNTQHSKQNRMRVSEGIPNVDELSEGVPVLRSVAGIGIVEYIRFKGQLYASTFTRGEPIKRSGMRIGKLTDGATAGVGRASTTNFPGTISNAIDDNTSSVKDDIAALAGKVNEIISALRLTKIIESESEQFEEYGI